jgi:hypothetical protein
MAFSPGNACLAPSSAGARYRARANRPGRPSLLLQQRLDPVFQFLERHRAFEPFAIYEKRSALNDLEHLKGEFLVSGESIEQSLIFLAGLDSLLAYAESRADQFQGVFRLRNWPLRAASQMNRTSREVRAI